MSKRNRRPPEIFPPSDSTRPEPELRAPEPILETREPDPLASVSFATDTNATVVCRWGPAYPCPRCYPRLGGIGKRQKVFSTVVHSTCDKCGMQWTASRRFDARVINCVPMIAIPDEPRS